MSVRAKILQVVLDPENDRGLAYAWLTHDLATATFSCDRTGVMYLGRMVQTGPIEEIPAGRGPRARRVTK